VACTIGYPTKTLIGVIPNALIVKQKLVHTDQKLTPNEVSTMQLRTRKVIRKPEIKHLNGLSNTSYFEQIKKGLVVPFFSIGARAVAVYEDEIITVTTARAAGKSDDEIRKIVKALIKQRETSANDLLKQLVA
jgi:prophage regulatory protein